MSDPRELINDPEEGQRLALDGRQSSIWTAMPGIVQSVEFAQMTCVVQLAIQGRFEDMAGNINWVNISPIQDVPIVFPSCAGFMITMPIAAGDEVLVVFASRCIDFWWQNGGFQNLPFDYRMHDLSDGFAIPGPKSVPNVFPSISSTACQIRNKLGTTYVEIDATGKIGLVSPTEIDITAPLINMTAATSVNMTTPILNITGGISLGGTIVSPSGPSATINITGNLTATGEITSGSIPLSTHIHGGVTTGAGDTGGPLP